MLYLNIELMNWADFLHAGSDAKNFTLYLSYLNAGGSMQLELFLRSSL